MTLSHSWSSPTLPGRSPAPPTTADARDAMPSEAVQSTVPSDLVSRAAASERER
jgi:hypothetical protein